MPTTGQRNARAALDAARAAFDALASDGAAPDGAQRYLDAWNGAEEALRSLAGTSTLTGLALVRELRQRNLLALDDAHALVDFHAAAERAKSDGYAPTPADVEVARRSWDRLTSAVTREALGQDGGKPVTGPISTPPSPRPAEPDPASLGAVAAPTGGNMLGIVMFALLLLAIVGGGAFYFMRRGGATPDELATGRKAYAAGDRVTARAAFSTAAGTNPALAEPHIYLGRMAREEGNFAEASQHLRRAVELEPANSVAMRELAGFLLASGQLELARSFYERAIRIDPQDRLSLGFMGCTMHRLGRPDLAQRFAARAGPGSWDQCLQAPIPPPGAFPPAAPSPAPR